jgi:hypothetical protein
MRRHLPFLLLILLCAGCANTGPALPASVPAKGIALLANGEPLGRVRLVFQPKKTDGISVEAFADTERDGRFVLTTYAIGDGAVPGEYLVSVQPYDYRDKSGSPRKNDAAAARIPRKYLSAETSDLVIAVGKDKPEIEIRLK